MATTIPGMYAAGDVCYDGSCAPGAVPAPPGRNRGSGILNAVFAGVVSGQQAAAYAADHAQQPIDDAQVAQLKEDAFAPLFREDGVKAKEVIDKIMELPEGTRCTILSPVISGKKGTHKDLIEKLIKEGYVRIRLDGEIVYLEEDEPIREEQKTFN